MGNRSKAIARGAIVTALNVMFIYAAAVLPTGRITALFISSLFIFAICCEGDFKGAFVAFGASSALCFMLVPDKAPVFAYIFFLGCYPIFKELLMWRFCGFMLYILKAIAFIISIAAIIAAGYIIGYIQPMLEMLDKIGIFAYPLAAIMLIVGFFAYDYMHTWLCSYYYKAIRPNIIRNNF